MEREGYAVGFQKGSLGEEVGYCEPGVERDGICVEGYMAWHFERSLLGRSSG